MIYKIFKILLIATSILSAFEVNTHQAITRCAITKECSQNGSANLHSFAKDNMLVINNYEKARFHGIYNNDTFFKYMQYGDGFKAYFIKARGNGYLDLIEAGVVLEDSVYPDALFSGDGRFNNHFYSAQFDAKSVCRLKSASAGGTLALINPELGLVGVGGGLLFANDMLSDKALCVGFGKRVDNITWALKKDMDLGNGRVNNNGLDDAFRYYRASFIGSESSQHSNQAKLFLTIGYLIHLIQDLHSPAHVRDGSHPMGDYLEIYGRYNGGFNLRNGEINPNNNPLIWQAIQSIDMKKSMLKNNRYSSYQDFYTHEANWVSKNFMSEEHMDVSGADNNKTGDGLNMDNKIDRDTIFDNYNPHLAEDETSQEVIPYAKKRLFGGDKWFFIKRNSFVEDTQEHGDTNIHNVVAIVEKGYFMNSERMTADVMGYNSKRYDSYDKTALSDTAIHVMPRAVVSSEAFINYFFRGRIKAVVDGDSLTIENISDPQWVSSADLCTFKTGMSIDIYYINDKNVSKELYSATLSNDVATGESITIDGLKSSLLGVSDWGEKKQIIVLLDGQLGEARGLDDYNINARGLVATYATIKNFPTDNDEGGNGDNNNTGGGDNNTSDPTKDPNKVCASNYFKYYNDGTLHETLQKGNKDVGVSDGVMHQVKELQEFLSAFSNNKYDVGKNGADGWFGSDTESALMSFQSDNGINATGITDDNTKKGINGKCFNK